MVWTSCTRRVRRRISKTKMTHNRFDCSNRNSDTLHRIPCFWNTTSLRVPSPRGHCIFHSREKKYAIIWGWVFGASDLESSRVPFTRVPCAIGWLLARATIMLQIFGEFAHGKGSRRMLSARWNKRSLSVRRIVRSRNVPANMFAEEIPEFRVIDEFLEKLLRLDLVLDVASLDLLFLQLQSFFQVLNLLS